MDGHDHPGLPVAAGSKKRISDDKVIIDTIVGDVDGKRAIVLDDEVATGGSVVGLAFWVSVGMTFILVGRFDIN